MQVMEEEREGAGLSWGKMRKGLSQECTSLYRDRSKGKDSKREKMAVLLALIQSRQKQCVMFHLCVGRRRLHC